MSASVAVIQLPGVNCERETAAAIEAAGLSATVFAGTRAPEDLRGFDAFVIPGGFSYQDRVRAGALAAKHPIVGVLAEEADRGKPVLGICNGAQVLVEAGLVPGGAGVELALARNRMPARDGYYTRWIRVRVEETPCVFARGLEPGLVIPLPMAHGEGRFVGATGRMEALEAAGQIPFRYARSDGRVATEFPDDPNGSERAAAGVCNARGNVLALMPHPERAIARDAVARSIAGAWSAPAPCDLDAGAGGPGPGLLLFRALREHLEDA